MLYIPETKRKHILILSDAANEADDAFAIAHALLTPGFDTTGMVAGHFDQEGSTQASLAVMERLTQLTKTADQFPVVAGAECPLAKNPVCLGGAKLILEKASQYSGKLFIMAIGALTDLALALKLNPSLAHQCTLVWVGGGRYPNGSRECNAMRDLEASNFVFASELPIIQIPSQAYKTLLVPISRLEVRLNSKSPLDHYLWTQLEDFSNRFTDSKPWISPYCWVMGDQGAIGVLLDEQKGYYQDIARPLFADDGSYLYPQTNRTIRVYHSLNIQMILDDMFCRLELFAKNHSESRIDS